MTNPKQLDRSRINGVEVISTEPARGVVIPGQPVREVKTVEKVLLEDGTECYRCIVKPDECDYSAATLKSVLAHQRTHSPVLTAKKATAELAAQKAKEDAEFQRRSAGIHAANEAKRARYAGEVTSNDKKIAAVQRKMSDIAFGIEKIAATLPPLAEMLRALNQELAEITAPETVIDPEIVEKASKYDALKGILNN